MNPTFPAPTPARKIRKLLVANRGEIAVRVIRTCRERGISTVAVYSDCDASSLHVRLADEAYPIGAPAPKESYLNIEKIIGVAKVAGVDAIHPGYGFLSENEDFATACSAADIIFVGPSAKTIFDLGNKVNARNIAMVSHVPTVPGTDGPVSSVDQAAAVFENVPFPIMIKAAAGGGGKGMRVVREKKDFAEAFTRASSEALSAFGDGSVYVEKFFEHPRHIEVQLIADSHGDVRHLFERECSIQRRHQKVFEESPSPVITPDLREAITSAAIRVAKASNYTGAGTAEFLYDNGSFYFLEMNTRLQVEHPVTEAITGLDLVDLQLSISEGGRLADLLPPDLSIYGHALECRIYAEDPDNFLPCPGHIRTLKTPQGPYVRIDSYAEADSDIPVYYDPMIAKLITWGRTREESIRRMQRALEEYTITGLRHNIPFLQRVLAQEKFKKGELATTFIQEMGPAPTPHLNQQEQDAVLAALALTLASRTPETSKHQDQQGMSGWKANGFRERLRA